MVYAKKMIGLRGQISGGTLGRRRQIACPFAVNFHVRFLDVSGALFKRIVRLAFDIAERGMSRLVDYERL